MNEWIDARFEVPPEDEPVLAIVCGKGPHVELLDAYVFASWSPDEGWIAEEYAEVYPIAVSHWMPLPELPEEDD